MRHDFQPLLLAGLMTLLVFGSSWANRSEEDLGRRATWTVTSKKEVQQLVQRWLDESQTDEDRRAQVLSLWSGEESVSLLDTLAESVAVVDPEARALVTFCQQSKSSYQLPEFSVLGDQDQPVLVRNNLRLLYARWLAHYQLYNEVLEQSRRPAAHGCRGPSGPLILPKRRPSPVAAKRRMPAGGRTADGERRCGPSQIRRGGSTDFRRTFNR